MKKYIERSFGFWGWLVSELICQKWIPVCQGWSTVCKAREVVKDATNCLIWDAKCMTYNWVTDVAC